VYIQGSLFFQELINWCKNGGIYKTVFLLFHYFHAYFKYITLLTRRGKLSFVCLERMRVFAHLMINHNQKYFTSLRTGGFYLPFHFQDDFYMNRRFLHALQRQGLFYSPYLTRWVLGFIHPSPTRRVLFHLLQPGWFYSPFHE